MAAGAGGAGDTTPGHVLGGWGSGLNFNWEGVFGLNLPGYITISDLGLPVGLGGIPFFQSGLGLPPLDAANAAESDLPPEIDRRDQPSDQTDIPSVALGPNQTTVLWGGVAPPAQIPSVGSIGGGTLSNDDWLAIMFPGTTSRVSTPTAQIVETEDEDVGWISDIYDTVDTSLGGWLPGGVPVGSSIPQVLSQQPDVSYPQGPVFIPPVTTPFPTNSSPQAVAMGCAPDDPMKGMVYKKFCGTYRWVKQTKRRRKQLVTQTDLKGLAALKGVLGGGKAFEVWIATHS